MWPHQGCLSGRDLKALQGFSRINVDKYELLSSQYKVITPYLSLYCLVSRLAFAYPRWERKQAFVALEFVLLNRLTEP